MRATQSENSDQNRNSSAWKTFSIATLVLGIVAGILYLCYLNIWTNRVSQHHAALERQSLMKMWDTPTSHANRVLRSTTVSGLPSHQDAHAGSSPLHSTSVMTKTRLGAFALLYIPRLRGDVWGVPIFDGMGLPQINAGIGHYPQSVMPGKVGNFALVGHRATYGAWLAHVDQLQPGDKVVVRVRTRWFVYTLDHHAIVSPHATWVLRATSTGGRRHATAESIITLITCNPRWGSSARWVWWGHLQRKVTATRFPTALVK